MLGPDKEFVITEAQTQGPGHSIPISKSWVQIPLSYPVAAILQLSWQFGIALKNLGGHLTKRSVCRSPTKEHIQRDVIFRLIKKDLAIYSNEHLPHSIKIDHSRFNIWPMSKLTFNRLPKILRFLLKWQHFDKSVHTEHNRLFKRYSANRTEHPRQKRTQTMAVHILNFAFE